MKRFLPLLAATAITMSMAGNSFAVEGATNAHNSGGESTTDYLKSYSTSKKPYEYAQTLTPDELLTLSIRVGKAVDNGETTIEAYIPIIMDMIKTLSPHWTPETYQDFLLTVHYPVAFREIIIEVAWYTNTDLDDIYIQLAQDSSAPENLRILAATSMQNGNTNKVDILQELYYEDFSPSTNNVLLKNIGFEDMDLAASIASDLVERYDSITPMEFAMADSILVKSLDSFEGAHAQELIKLNEMILTETDDELVIEACLQALQELKPEQAAQIVLQNVDLL